MKKRILSMIVLLMTAAVSAVAQLYGPPGGGEKTITLSPNNLTLTVGEEATVSYSLSGLASAIPSWRITEGDSYISFKSIGTGSSKTVIANAPGTATIECYATGWTSGYCTVTVVSNYKVSLKGGTEDATNWQGKAGTGDYQSMPLEGVAAGTAVNVKYSGTKMVKSVKAKKKAAAPSVPDGAINGKFSVSDTKQVYFSKGNLRYASSKWSFFDNQYDYYTSYSAGAWDKFGWSTSATTYGMNTSTDNATYSGDFVDWGATMGTGWFTLSSDEWTYLLNTRSASTVGGTADGRCAKAKVNDVQGIILFPDTYTHPDGVTAPTGVNATDDTGWNGNSYTAADWTKMESAGCVFLPAAGFRGQASVNGAGSYGYYWSSSPYTSDAYRAYLAFFYSGTLNPASYSNRNVGYSVRLVQATSDAAPTGNSVDLSTLTADYEAKDGETLTGTLTNNVKISIADGATVTLDGVTINGTNNSSYQWAGITCEGDATIILSGTNTVKGFAIGYPGIFVSSDKTLTINGTGSLTASSYGHGAGIGGGYYASCGNIEIQGGTITSTGGQFAAGIGGGNNTGCGNITISGGTVTATGGQHGAGIGGGRRGTASFSCGNIIISGGTVTATGGEYAAGIGGGKGYNESYKSSCGTITITTGVTQVTATKGSGADNSIGAGYLGTCGTVTIGGTKYWENNAAVGDGATYLAQSPLIYDPAGPTDLSTISADYEAKNGETLTGTLNSNVKISIADGATVTLKNVNITNLGNSCDWAGINCPGDATLVLEGTNEVCAGRGGDYGMSIYPGIWIAPNKTLTIQGNGKLTASSNGFGAGIGGGYSIACGDISIEGGIITAGGQTAAGIGSGFGAICGNITISGGTVTATGGYKAAGIGGGPEGTCGAITIANTVTKVTATKDQDAPYSIGAGGYSGGNLATCGTVTIGGTKYWENNAAVDNDADNYLKQATIVYPKLPATVTTAPTGAAIVGRLNTNSTALVSGGVADGGKLMYAVTTTNTKPTSTAGFSDAVPTAKDITASGTVYVWYYVKADDTHSDSEIAATAIEVPVADIVWDVTNVGSNLSVNDGHPYEKEDVKLSANDLGIQALWYDSGDPTHDGISFTAYQSGGFTFTAPTGKAFTKIEMTLTEPGGWIDANLGTDWAFDYSTVTWKGSAAASTVGLLTDAEMFHGDNVKSIVFYLSE